MNKTQGLNLKKIFNIIFLAVVFTATIWSVLYGENVKEVFAYLTTAEPRYIITGFGCVIFFILGESVVIFYLLRSLGIRTSFFHCSLYSFIGFFYSCITPSASGGQPMQVVAMRKDRIPAAVSSVVLAIVTVTYKMVLVLMGLTVLLFRPAAIMVYLEPVKEWIYLGIVLNSIFITALLLLVFDTNAVMRVVRWVYSIVHVIHPLKHPEKQEQSIAQIANQYRGAAEYYRAHKVVILNVFLVTFLQRCCLFFITWLIYCSFELTGHSLPVITALQSMISVAADMLPLPGGMGISENLFLDIFSPVFGEELVLPGMILSRGISFYMQLLISAVMTIVASFIIKEKK